MASMATWKSRSKWLVTTFVTPIALLVATTWVSRVLKQEPERSRSDISIGFANSSVRYPEDLQQLLTTTLADPANSLLGELSSRYKFRCDVRSGRYDEVIKALAMDRIDLGVIPPYTYVHYLNTHDSLLLKGLKLVGFKYPSTGIWYYSGFVLPCNLQAKSLDSTFFHNVKKSKRKAVLVLGYESKSTSTSVIPWIRVAERRLNNSFDTVWHLSRPDMLRRIKTTSDTVFVGTLSTDEWEDARRMKVVDSSATICFIRDTIPIPYDVVCINSDTWRTRYEGIGGKGKEILDALRSWAYTKDVGSHDWINNNSAFISYVTTGIIASVTTTDKLTRVSILFPHNDTFQLWCDLIRDHCDSVDVIKWRFGNHSNQNLLAYPALRDTIRRVKLVDIEISKDTTALEQLKINASISLEEINPSELSGVHLALVPKNK